MIEAFGYIASVVLFISYLMRDIIKLRLINTIACAMFLIYGLLLGLIPVVVVNVMVIIVNLYYLLKPKK
jgi:hypothetical protein